MSKKSERKPYHVIAERQIQLLLREVMHENWVRRHNCERLTRVQGVCDWIDCCQLTGGEALKRAYAAVLEGSLQEILLRAGYRGPNCRLLDESYDRIAVTAQRLREDFLGERSDTDRDRDGRAPSDTAEEPQ